MKSTLNKMKHVFEKIGGEPALEQILDLFYKKMQEDILIGFFFLGKDIRHIAQQQRKFLMRAWGVQRTYDGKPPATAHITLPPILQGHFDRRLVLLKETLESFQGTLGLEADEIKAWLQFEKGFEKILVKKEK